VSRLQQIGWPSSRFPYALTVVLNAPPEPIVRKWRLATSNGSSHVVCVPGVGTGQIDALVGDLHALTSSAAIPRQPGPVYGNGAAVRAA
jgi:histidine decarboxylase